MLHYFYFDRVFYQLVWIRLVLEIRSIFSFQYFVCNEWAREKDRNNNLISLWKIQWIGIPVSFFLLANLFLPASKFQPLKFNLRLFTFTTHEKDSTGIFLFRMQYSVVNLSWLMTSLKAGPRSSLCAHIERKCKAAC